jgi:hypothetical protein
MEHILQSQVMNYFYDGLLHNLPSRLSTGQAISSQHAQKSQAF